MNTVKDTDYAYIDTFINFLNRIVDIVERLFGIFNGAFDKLGK